MRFLEQRQARADEDSRALDRQRTQDAEDYAILKIRLETEIQTLEQDLEEMRATYQLNSEKLDYNYRVLQERDQENGLTIQQQKRKLARLQDLLSGLKGRHAREDAKFRADNAELTDDFKRLTEQFKELQSKFVHFEQSDSRRYRALWNMNEAEVTALMRSVLQADKLLHEQQLGLHWYPPSDAIFSDASEQHAPPELGASAAAEGGEGGALAAAGAQPANEQVAAMLTLLCNEAGFLVEAKVRRLLEPIAPEEQDLLKVDSILKVLGIESAADVEKVRLRRAEQAAEGRTQGRGRTGRARANARSRAAVGPRARPPARIEDIVPVCPTCSLTRRSAWPSPPARAPAPVASDAGLLPGRLAQPRAHPPERRDQGDQGVRRGAPGQGRRGQGRRARRRAQRQPAAGRQPRGGRVLEPDVRHHQRQDRTRVEREAPRRAHGGCAARARDLRRALRGRWLCA